MEHAGPSQVLIGLGANVGDPPAQLARAVERIGALVSVERVSDVYRSEPVGYRDQPDFLNLVLAGRTALAPAALLAGLHAIEREMGRVRTFRNAPRAIDIDLLAVDAWVLEGPGLHLPHPRMHQRGFVLVPLAEIAPDWRHPVSGLTPGEMLRAAAPPERVERWGALPPIG